MSDPKNPLPVQPKEIKNKWLAQSAQRELFNQEMVASGMRISTLPHPLQQGSAVITIPFSKGSSPQTPES